MWKAQLLVYWEFAILANFNLEFSTISVLLLNEATHFFCYRCNLPKCRIQLQKLCISFTQSVL